ncbi:hypothetical protein M9H77_03063 [Catharanthus roseus]|uniref:Uncharacterized protein n=1 Tax=Catharanthus roseus TaxID=4058 RepID=A0ACC0CAD5_CATRO|nr:hypothetical protein M9H77_03063 [Catharanthus roseus]
MANDGSNRKSRDGLFQACKSKVQLIQGWRLCVNAYGGSHHRDRHFIHWSQMGIGIENEESMKLSLLEKYSMVNELLQARIEIEESVEIHVEEETSKEDPCDFMSEETH